MWLYMHPINLYTWRSTDGVSDLCLFTDLGGMKNCQQAAELLSD